MKKVLIRTFISGWHLLDFEKAKRIIQQMINGSNINKSTLINYINLHFLKGVTVQDLLN